MKAASARNRMPGFSNVELNQLIGATRTRRFPAGSWICREGETASSSFIIASGAVEVIKYLDGQERVLATLRPGALVGPTALVEGSLRSASVRVRSDTIALEFRRKAFQRFVQEGSPLSVRFQEQLAMAGIRQLRAATDRLAQVLAHAVRASEKRPATVDRLALAFIQAGTGEWGVRLGTGSRQSVWPRTRKSE